MLARHRIFVYFDVKYTLMRAFLFSLLCSCFLTGCEKEPEQGPAKYCGKYCTTLSYTPVFSNYLPEELDSVIIKHYDSTHGVFSLNVLISTNTYSLADTIHVYNAAGQPLGIGLKALLPSDQDHSIEVYAANRVYKIWNIKETEEQETYECSQKDFSCARRPHSFSSSGGQFRVEQWGDMPAYLIMSH